MVAEGWVAESQVEHMGVGMVQEVQDEA